MKRILPMVAAIAAGLLLQSCSSDGNATEQVTEAKPKGWATVNGTPITEAELDHALNRFFGEQFIDARAEYQVRDSLIASRAIAQKAEANLSAEELAAIEVAVAAYREERLIAAYIQSLDLAEPVSSQQVKTYYDNNLDQFGAEEVKRLAVLELSLDKSQTSEAKASQQLFTLAKSGDWSQSLLPTYIRYYESASNSSLPASIAKAIKPLEIGQQTNLIRHGGQLLIVKVVDVENIPAKPLAEVSREIRRRLAATQLKQTVKALSDSIVSESDVVKHY